MNAVILQMGMAEATLLVVLWFWLFHPLYEAQL